MVNRNIAISLGLAESGIGVNSYLDVHNAYDIQLYIDPVREPKEGFQFFPMGEEVWPV